MNRFVTCQSFHFLFLCNQDYNDLASQINKLKIAFLECFPSSFLEQMRTLSSVTSVTESLKQTLCSYFDSNYKLSLAEQIRLSIDFNLFEGPENIVNELADNVRFYDRELLSNLNRFYESQKSVQHTLQLPTFVLPQTSREVFLHAYCLRAFIHNGITIAVEEEKLIGVNIRGNKGVFIFSTIHPD